MSLATQVGKLPAGGGREQHVTRGGAVQSRPHTLQCAPGDLSLMRRASSRSFASSTASSCRPQTRHAPPNPHNHPPGQNLQLSDVQDGRSRPDRLRRACRAPTTSQALHPRYPNALRTTSEHTRPAPVLVQDIDDMAARCDGHTAMREPLGSPDSTRASPHRRRAPRVPGASTSSRGERIGQRHAVCDRCLGMIGHHDHGVLLQEPARPHRPHPSRASVGHRQARIERT